MYAIVKNIYKLFFIRHSEPYKLQLLLRETIRKKIKNKKEFFFVQIGSNDGKKGDPLFNLVFKYKLHGILVEPVPYLFQRLTDNYKGLQHLIFENAAIGDPKQDLKFYRLVETPGLPNWHNQLGTFKKHTILTHKFQIPDIEKLIIEEKINVMSFEDLMKKHQVSEITILHIDTEGYDFEIIKSIDFTKWKIENILFENMHLSAPEEIECTNFLQSKGFHCIVKYGADTFCTRNKIKT